MTATPAKQHRIIAVIGLPPLPGSVLYDGRSVSRMAADAVAEARILQQAGIDGVILQNIGDVPTLEKVGKETVACMSAVAYALRAEMGAEALLGISVLRNDGEAAVAVAKSCEADFIRAKVYVGAMISAGGIETACMGEVLNMRHKLDCGTGIWADVQSRTGTPLGGWDLLQECGYAAEKGLCDAFILSSRSVQDAIQSAAQVRERYPDKLVVLGGGATPDNIAEAAVRFDATVVGTYIKIDGKIANPIDNDRLAVLMQAMPKN